MYKSLPYFIVLNDESAINRIYCFHHSLPIDFSDSQLKDSDYYWLLSTEIYENLLHNSDIEYDSYVLRTPLNYREIDEIEASCAYKKKTDCVS